MILEIVSPVRANILNYSQNELRDIKSQLTYTNLSIQHLIRKHYQNTWWRGQNPKTWSDRLEDLKKNLNKTLVFEDNGQFYIRTGSISYLNDLNIKIINKLQYPIPKAIAWAKVPTWKLYNYQEESLKRLLEAKHANVSICTGGGKSNIILKLCRETGFKCAVVAPSRSIFNELVEKFEYYLGKNNVGRFGDGKKKLGKRITICIGDSLTNIEKDTEEWNFFSNLEMLAIDESHTWGAETLENVCHGVLANVPYRFFFSGTQTRGDGQIELLQSIIGSTVYSLTTKQAIDGKFICPHDYVIVDVESSNPNFNDSDALEMKRIHFLRNKNIAAFAAKLANAKATTKGEQTLILVEELNQIAMLIPLLTVPYAAAHSEKKKERLAELGFDKVDPKESVEKFNKNEVKVLIGTSCIATGTNIYPTHNTINWVGGSSEIKTKQGAIGRSVRLGIQNPYANQCLIKERATIWDFRVTDVRLMLNHLDERLAYYAESGSDIRFIKLK